ncbi:MAG TPA: dockerin type I domain-containing protein [Phycisphaerae bacterium]|nr:dockerin type I domain-containing protein [Phycisphaerae bacterium]
MPAYANSVVIVSLSSPSNGTVVPHGHLIQWTIKTTVSTGDNMGLALIVANLEQNPDNPQLIDLSPGIRPDGMLDFDRPRGLSNPGGEGQNSGYGGTPTGNVGATNLAQIGGGQNTFGVPGSHFGQDVDVEAGIGQGPDGQIIAMGSFPAPSVPGPYTFALRNTVANTLLTIHPAPDFSLVGAAEVALEPAEITFTVCRSGDVDGDGKVSVEGDVPAFVRLLLGTSNDGDYARCAADANDDGSIDGQDVQSFVNALLTAAEDTGRDWHRIAEEGDGSVQPPSPPKAAPTIPGDGDLDWCIDANDFLKLDTCFSGPRLDRTTDCITYDFDEDGDTDLFDLASFQTAFAGPEMLIIDLSGDGDDGTEVDGAAWYPDGCDWYGHNYVGISCWGTYDAGFRFHLPQIRQGETIACARLAFPATGYGQVDSAAVLRIVGIDLADPPDFSEQRPSQLPKTTAAVDWVKTSDWPAAAGDFDYDPVIRYSPDISPIINEIIQRLDWGDEGNTTAAIVIQNNGPKGNNYLVFRDYDVRESCHIPRIMPRLEIYRTARSALVGKEFLSRPTDRSITVNTVPLVKLEAYFEYGSSPHVFDQQTPVVYYPGGTPVAVVLSPLSADTRYYYRMRYRQLGESEFFAGPERSFHTQRLPGSGFTFAVQTDSHLHNYRNYPDRCDLYRMTLNNIWADAPDFLIDLGDTFNSESYEKRSDWFWYGGFYSDVVDFEEAVQRHLDQRPYLDLVCHSAPFFFALGNHEGEQGWRLNGSPNNVAVWATNARKMVYPLPEPDGFYTGNQEETAYCGLREDYYAWQWGDALFVVLDPYWYTTRKPHSYGGPGSGDNWDWTLGYQQYEWLWNTLANSSATFKFVFAHQVTGGVITYGRGGIEAARFALAQRGSYEWGGEDKYGQPVFPTMRPHWSAPIHQVMAANNVTIFFHAHDHTFVHQELDGVVYQECPQPSDSYYSSGFADDGLYIHGDQVNNSGHLRVSVSPAAVTVEYIRAYLPGDGPNAEVAYSYTVSAK